MRFVEETGGSWAAEQLRAAEAEIEQQKREWEARLVAMKKEEEDEKRAAEEDEMLTYSREDAQNQVNNNKFSKRKQPINRRMLKLKQNNRNNVSNSKRIRDRNQIEEPIQSVAPRVLGTRRALRNNSKPISSLAKAEPVVTVRRSIEPKTSPKPVTNAPKRLAPTRLSTRRLAKRTRRDDTKASSDEENDETDDGTTKDNNGVAEASTKAATAESGKAVEQSECSELPRSEDFDDSECSLDVMVDSTDPQETDETSNATNNDDGDEDFDENDEEDEDNESTIMNSDVSEASDNDNDSDYAKLNNTSLNSTLKNASLTDNHINVNSPRTRSHGRVKIDLWTLDKNQKVPELCAKRSLNKSNGSKNSSLLANTSTVANDTERDHCENGNDSLPENEYDSDGSVEENGIHCVSDQSSTAKINTSLGESKTLKQSKISDCFSKASRLSGASTPSNTQSDTADNSIRTRKSLPAKTTAKANEKASEKSEPIKKAVTTTTINTTIPASIKSRTGPYDIFINNRSPKVVLNKEECELQHQKARMKNKS